MPYLMFSYRPYDALGELVSAIGSSINNFLYRGEEYNPETGNYYLRARYYEQKSGRFISRDPVAGDMLNPLSLNGYGYCYGNPVNYIDPSGMLSLSEMTTTIAVMSILSGMTSGIFTYARTGSISQSISAFVTTSVVTMACLYIPELGQALFAYGMVMTGIEIAQGKFDYLDVGELASQLILFALFKSYINGKYAPVGVEADGTCKLPVSEQVNIGEKANVLMIEGNNSGAGGNGKSNSKSVPNPYGKGGGPAHQEAIQNAADTLKKDGSDVTFEQRVEIPDGGYKHVRYGDILVTDPVTGEQWIIQVGKQTKTGNPISRENKAIQDLISAGYKVLFVPYN